MRTAVLHQEGQTNVGGASGRFDLDASLHDGSSRLTMRSGPMVEANGWDVSPWAARDGAVILIGLPSAIADAAGERFLRGYGWRDRAARRYMRFLPPRIARGRAQLGIAVAIPGASSIDLWFDQASHRLAEADMHADMGLLTTTFGDWRSVSGADYAYRREQRDVAGQATVLTVETSRVDPIPIPARPKSIDRGHLLANVSQPFVLDKGDRGHIVVDAIINGRPAKLVFDTGAANYLTPTAARRYGLAIEGGLDVGGVGETSIAGGYARIRNLSVGEAQLIDTIAIIAPLPDAATHPQPGVILQGLTGAELIAAFTTTIDYNARTLSFAPPDDTIPKTGAVLPMVSDGEALFVEASVEGATGWFRLDTGDPGMITLFPGFARAHDLADAEVQNSSRGEVGGVLRTRKRRFSHVTIAGRSFADVVGDVSAQRAGSFSSRSIAGNLGAGLLSCFVMTLDLHHGRAAFAALPANNKSGACQSRL